MIPHHCYNSTNYAGNKVSSGKISVQNLFYLSSKSALVQKFMAYSGIFYVAVL